MIAEKPLHSPSLGAPSAAESGMSEAASPLDSPTSHRQTNDPTASVEPAPVTADSESLGLSGLNGDVPRIAVYNDPHGPPLVIPVADYPLTPHYLPELIDTLTVRAHSLAREQGGGLPLPVFRELVENLVHASFAGVVITILDGGNTIRVSDRGPGIPDKGAALQPGFTSADADAKRLIRGVGSGFSLIQDTLTNLDGVLEIDDNLGQGTVVTARVSPQPTTALASAAVPAYNLSERQLKTLLLAVELAPVGPTRIARELGVSTSTAYRDLVSLEEAGLVISGDGGHRSVTDTGLAYLDAVL